MGDCYHLNVFHYSQARYSLLGVRSRGAEIERSGQRCRSRVPSGGSALSFAGFRIFQPDPDPVASPDPQNMNKKFVHK